MVISREVVRNALRRYLDGTISKEEISDWAYSKLAEDQGHAEDELVSEVLYNLVSFHSVGLIFAQYRPSLEKLEYLEKWLSGYRDCDWEHYKRLFQPFTGNLN